MSADAGSYNSWGNGSAIRTSPVGYVFEKLEDVLRQAEYYAASTHNHPEGIKGDQVTSTGTATPWPASPAALPKPFLAGYRR